MASDRIRRDARLRAAGARLTMQAPGVYLCERDGKSEQIQISEDTNGHFDGDGPLYAPGSAGIRTPRGRIAAAGIHAVEDEDR